MAQSKKIVEFHLKDGTPFLMEIEETAGKSQERATRGDLVDNAGKAAQSFEAALDKAVPVATAKAAFMILASILGQAGSIGNFKIGALKSVISPNGVFISGAGGSR